MPGVLQRLSHKYVQLKELSGILANKMQTTVTSLLTLGGKSNLSDSTRMDVRTSRIKTMTHRLLVACAFTQPV